MYWIQILRSSHVGIVFSKLILATFWLIKLYGQVFKKGLLLGKIKQRKKPPESKVAGVFSPVGHI